MGVFRAVSGQGPKCSQSSLFADNCGCTFHPALNPALAGGLPATDRSGAASSVLPPCRRCPNAPIVSRCAGSSIMLAIVLAQSAGSLGLT